MLPKFAELHARLDAALTARSALLARRDLTALRIVHGEADGLPGLVIEKLGDTLIAQLHEGKIAIDESAARSISETAMARLGCSAVYRKTYPLDRDAALARLAAAHTNASPWIGSPVAPEIEVRENDIRFIVRAYDGYSTGLFLEQRNNRARVRQLAAGRRVLNGFAYTCGFSVAAALGGAAQTVSVDVSKRSLEWGKRNFAANTIDVADPKPNPHVFICSDMFDYFERAARQARRFDLIILDPPTFGRDKQTGRTFSIESDLPRLVAAAVNLLDRPGILLLSANHRATRLARLEYAVQNTQLGRSTRIECLPLPPDFAGDADYCKSVLAEWK